MCSGQNQLDAKHRGRECETLRNPLYFLASPSNCLFPLACDHWLADLENLRRQMPCVSVTALDRLMTDVKAPVGRAHFDQGGQLHASARRSATSGRLA